MDRMSAPAPTRARATSGAAAFGVGHRQEVAGTALGAPALDRRERTEDGLGRTPAGPAFPLKVCFLNSRSLSSSGRPTERSVVEKMATRSQSRSASSRRWVVRKIVTPRLRKLVDQLVHLAGGHRVEARGRLVQEDDLGVVQQRPGQPDPLAEALGKGAAGVFGPCRPC